MQPPNPPEVVRVLLSVDAQGRWDPHALELLSDARAVARRCNGIVGAWVHTAPTHPPLRLEDLAACGCRHLWHLKNDRFATWSSEAVVAALGMNPSPGCRLILLPATARGEEVAGLLAGRLDTLWVPDALTLSVTRTGSIEIAAIQSGGKLSRTFRAPVDRTIVVTMRPGVAEARREPAEPIVVDEKEVDLSLVPVLTAVEQFIPADPKTIDLVLADKIVSAGRGVGGAEGVRLVSRLADVLHASLGASRMAVDLGWVPQPRQVGQTGRTVRPDLYVACGISGASHHLAGMRDSKHIVAVNSDPSAPIHEVAHLSLRGDLHRVIPSILASLEMRRAGTSEPRTP